MTNHIHGEAERHTLHTYTLSKKTYIYIPERKRERRRRREKAEMVAGDGSRWWRRWLEMVETEDRDGGDEGQRWWRGGLRLW